MAETKPTASKETSTEKSLIFDAMNAAMKAISPIPKDSVNKEQHFKFRGIDAVLTALHPIFAEHGLFVTQDVVEHLSTLGKTKSGGNVENVVLKVVHTFYALDGSSIKVTTMGEAMDVGDKAYSKAQSVALRICLLNTFAIPTGEPDADADSYERGGNVDVPKDWSTRINNASTLDELRIIKDQVTSSALADNVKQALGDIWQTRVEDVKRYITTQSGHADSTESAPSSENVLRAIAMLHSQMTQPERADFFSNVVEAGIPSIQDGMQGLDAIQQARVLEIATVIVNSRKPS